MISDAIKISRVQGIVATMFMLKVSCRGMYGGLSNVCCRRACLLPLKIERGKGMVGPSFGAS